MRFIKFLSIIVVTFFSIHISTAQTVMGININNRYAVVSSQLAKKGYRPIKKKQGEHFYKIKFNGYENCTLSVSFNTEKNDSVLSFVITFSHKSPNDDEWMIQYPLERQLTEKYGKSKREDLEYEPLGEHGTSKGYCNFKHGDSITLGRFWHTDKEGREIGGSDENHVYLIYSTNVTPHQKKVESDI